MKISITNDIRQVDETLFESLKRFRHKDYLVPTNREKERETFFEARRKGEQYNPVFEYKSNPDSLKKIKTTIANLHVQDPIFENIYQPIIQEKLQYIELIETRSPSLFCKTSQDIFGTPSPEMVQQAFDVLKRYKPEDETGVFFGIKILSEKIRERLAADHIEGWSISESNEGVWIAEIDHTNRKILLEQGIIINQDMVNHLVRKCIEVSIFRSKNAERQPLRMFELGLSRHEETEAGLALEMSIGFGLFHPKFLIHAARGVIAAHYAHMHSFYETFQALHKILPEDTAYDFAEKVKIGLIDTKEPGGWIREHCAFQGRKKIQTLPNQDLYYLYAGNVSYAHLELVQSLISQNILHEPAFVPHFLYEK